MVTSPSRVAVVGAGMVGLSTAWFLNERGVQVTVLERSRVAAGSSWGNAGWLTPGLATPLPDPAVLSYGIRAVLSSSSPVYVPPSPDPRLVSFLTRFARNSTPARWRRAMDALVPVNRLALDAFDQMAAGGVRAEVHEAKPFLAAFRTEEERQGLLDEVAHIQAQGQGLEYDVLDGPATRGLAPVLTDEVGAGLVLHGQRYLTPHTFVADLASTLVERGVVLREGVEVHEGAVRAETGGVVVAGERYDAVVLATGAWLGTVARQFGVRQQVRPGRGYSFTVPIGEQVPGPLYFPPTRVACTPAGDRLRVAGMMEFRPVDAPLDPRRITAVVEAVRPFLDGPDLGGVDLDDRRDEWVGSRPCTVDGLPLAGATTHPRVFVAGGHGMWGITLGPVTGRLLAEQVLSGRRPDEFAPFDPLR